MVKFNYYSIGAILLLCPPTMAKEPFNTTGLMDDVAIGGFDPVSYFSAEVSRTLKPTRGQPRYLVPYEGVDFYFSAEENADQFRETPEHYIPQFNGFCAYSLAKNNQLLKPSGEIWGIYDNKLYLFINHSARRQWDASDWRNLISNAEDHWAKFSKP